MENKVTNLAKVPQWECGNCHKKGAALKTVPQKCPNCNSRKIWWPNGVMQDPKGQGLIHFQVLEGGI